MTLDEILAFELPAGGNCVMFMWIVTELLDELKAILASKGFAYRSHCVWDKGDPPGLGHWFRFQHEILVLAVKGGEAPAPAPGTQWKSIVRAPREEHSRKPEIFADLITAYFPTCSKLEMFYRAMDDPEAERLRRANRGAGGWYFHGNEANFRELTVTIFATTAAAADR